MTPTEKRHCGVGHGFAKLVFRLGGWPVPEGPGRLYTGHRKQPRSILLLWPFGHVKGSEIPNGSLFQCQRTTLYMLPPWCAR